MIINPLFATDAYKISHRRQYPQGTTMVYSNLTPRSDRLSPIPRHLSTGEVTFFGLQYFLKDFLIAEWRDGFFKCPKDAVVAEYKRRISAYLGPDAASTDHIEALHDLGYLPVCIKALPEGTNVPVKIPVLTIHNTHPDFAWLTNYLETALSAYLWKPTTSATIARHYRLLLDHYADLTGADKSFVQFQGHDFSCRGLSGMQDAALTGAGHLTSFVGTDTIPAIDLAEQYYNADVTQSLVGTSVAATEHSVMCSNILTMVDDFPEAKMELAEEALIKRLITETYPQGIVSIVSDSFDFWRVVSEILPALKDIILNREGKVVIRPDSGDPVEIVCGKEVFDLGDIGFQEMEDECVNILTTRVLAKTPQGQRGTKKEECLLRWRGSEWRCLASVLWKSCDQKHFEVDRVRPHSMWQVTLKPEEKGAVQCLWDTFGGTVNEKGYKVLNPAVGIIYGDSITLERAEAILKGLEAKGFASSNIVFGIGSFTYNYTTRDSFGFAVKSTAVIVDDKVVEIYKDPKTDNGTKKSARGFLSVQLEDGKLVLHDRQPQIDMSGCQLREVFRDGELLINDDFQTIRNRVLERGGGA